MTAKENLLAVLSGGAAEWMPVCLHITNANNLPGFSFVVHDCGHIRDLLPDFRTAGVDAVHCLTLPPMGNTTAAEARAALAPDTAAMIRMDPQMLLTGDFAAIDAWVAALAAGLGDWRQALVIVPCGRASLWNIRRLIERVHRLRQ